MMAMAGRLHGMVYCRGCGKEIHESAVACPQCGAVQNVVTGGMAKNYPNLSDKWAWTLACIPILSSIIAGFIGAMLSIQDIAFLDFILSITGNCILLVLDTKELNRNGLDAGNWLWLGIFLIPVYMFMRASKTNRQYGYAILWCCLFVLSLA